MMQKETKTCIDTLKAISRSQARVLKKKRRACFDTRAIADLFGVD
jgi:hypothetical protein